MDFAPKLSTRHSHVVQRRIGSPMEAQKEFEKIGKDGSIPVVLVPRWPYFFHLLTNIPSGVYVLWQKWHAKQGQLPPGLKVLWPAWNRVSHIVTKATKTYNAPVQNCPTSDNVLVAVDVSLMFQIQDPEKFVYELGAHRFDEFLSAQTDEAIRGLVHEVPALKVHDLREEFAMGMKTGLNRKINRFGVVISHVKITNVELPKALSETLQNTTSFKTLMEQQKKGHAANMRVLLDTAAQKLTAIKKQNARDEQDLRAAIDRALIDRERRRLNAVNKRDVAVVQAKTKASVDKQEAESEKMNAKKEAESEMVQIVEKARADAESRKIKATQALESLKIRKQADLEEAQAKAKAISADANVEAMAAQQLKEQRQFEIDNQRFQVLSGLASKGRMVISGETGEALLQGLCPGSKADLSGAVH